MSVPLLDRLKTIGIIDISIDWPAGLARHSTGFELLLPTPKLLLLRLRYWEKQE